MLIGCKRHAGLYFSVVEKTEYQELSDLLNELSDLSAVRLLVLFMEDIMDVVLWYLHLPS